MTRETRHFIGLSEILGVEHECQFCHLRIFSGGDREWKLPIQCSNCNKELVTDTEDLEKMRAFIKHLHYLRTRGEAFRGLRFQIEGPSDENK
jgi:hypothetical protein